MPAKLAKAEVTPVRQRSQFSCMAASLSMALKCHGQDHCDEDTVNKVLGAKPMQGASWEQALACAQHYGMRGTLTSPCTLRQLKAWTDAGIPVLIAWNPEGRDWSHASLVFDVDDEENVYVADPNIPDPDETVRVVPKADFYAKWYEKWPNYLVRRPAMAIEREITSDGRQVLASERMSGKKERRSLKDKGMARFFQHGPVRPTEKSDATRAMSKAQWEARKEEGRAGLPGAGLGAGLHKDKSQYDRKREKSFDREAGEEGKSSMFMGVMQNLMKRKKGLPPSPTQDGHVPPPPPPRWKDLKESASSSQPLKTRRDYGVTASMKSSDYKAILKYAENLPPEVEKDVEEIKKKNPDYSEGQAWATAWSIHCKYRDPGSEHCQKSEGEYFTGRTAGLSKVAGYSHYWEFTEFFDPSRWPKVVATAKVIAAKAKQSGISIAGPSGTGSPEFSDAISLNGDGSKDEDYESFYMSPEEKGFQFCKTGERPYDAVVVSILAAAKKILGKGIKVSSDGGPGALRRIFGKFERGVTMTVDEVAEVVGPEFKAMNENPPEAVVKVKEEMQKKAGRSPLLARETFADLLKDSKFEKGVSADPTENMTEEDAAEWERQNEEHKDEFKTADLEAILHREDDGTAPFDLFFNRTAAPKWVEKNDSLGHRWMMDGKGDYIDAAHIQEIKGPGIPLYVLKFILKDGSAIKDRTTYKKIGDAQKAALKWIESDAEGASLVFQRFSKLAAVTAGGKWGFTKGTETACTAGVNKLAKSAKRIASELYAKDEGSVRFLQKHAAKAGSKTASMLLKAMEDIGPAAALKASKIAGKSGNGLYGFSEKTAKLGLQACSDLHHEAGMIAADLFARKGADPVKVAGYLTANAKKGKCAFSEMLAEVAPDVAVEVTGTVKQSGKDLPNRPKTPDKSFYVEHDEDTDMWCLFGEPSGFCYESYSSKGEAQKALKGKKPSKKATDFLASEEDPDAEVADIISKC